MSRSNLKSRRNFVRSSAAAGLAMGLGDLTFLSQLKPVSAKETKLNLKAVDFDSGIEPLVQLLEKTPRNILLEEVAAKIAKGTSYREVVTALYLAGIRNIPPRPDVGWKFHAVLCVHSAHQASMASDPQDRWLPIFYALDFFKSQQMYDERESNWSLSKVDEKAVPPAHKAISAFNKSMENWDDDAADAATAAMVRSAGATNVFERFAYYGMRDFRNIGHKEIFMSGSWRMLQSIGWQHAEPVMRSLTYALLNHHDEPNPSKSDVESDKPWKHNLKLVGKIRADWLDGKVSSSATSDLLSTMRTGSWTDASQQVVHLLNNKVSPQSIQDALFTGAAEVLMRQPTVYALHAVTATHAMGYAFRTSSNDKTRKLLLMQNAAFLPQFRDFLKGKTKLLGEWGSSKVDALKPTETKLRGDEALGDIFRNLSGKPSDAVGKVLTYLEGKDQHPEDFINAARKLIFLKTQNSHHYKFSSAVMEDYYFISPEWRDRYLASSVFYLRGSDAPDNKLVKRTREILKHTG